MHDVVLVAIPPRRVTHLPTGDLGTVLGVDADGYQVVRFDGERYPLSLKDEVLAAAAPADEVAGALNWSHNLLSDADGVQDWLDRTETRRVNEANGKMLHGCRWCDGDVWADANEPGPVSCRSCRYKDGG